MRSMLAREVCAEYERSGGREVEEASLRRQMETAASASETSVTDAAAATASASTVAPHPLISTTNAESGFATGVVHRALERMRTRVGGPGAGLVYITPCGDVGVGHFSARMSWAYAVGTVDGGAGTGATMASSGTDVGGVSMKGRPYRLVTGVQQEIVGGGAADAGTGGASSAAKQNQSQQQQQQQVWGMEYLSALATSSSASAPAAGDQGAPQDLQQRRAHMPAHDESPPVKAATRRAAVALDGDSCAGVVVDERWVAV